MHLGLSVIYYQLKNKQNDILNQLQIIILLNDVNKTKKSIPYICKVKREYCRFPNFQDFCLIGIEALQLLYFDKAFFMKKMNTHNEQWKAIAECNGEYYISDHGRVKSFKNGKERILKAGITTRGYLQNELSIEGKRKNWALHRLVAIAFIPNPENKLQVNHKDGNKKNNNVDNLEWMTSEENMQHAWNTGLFESKRLAQSKQVIDKLTNKKYDSLVLACMDINEPYKRHSLRNLRNSPLQRFFYV